MLLGEGLHGGGSRTPPGLELCTLRMVTKCTGGPVPGWGLGLWGATCQAGAAEATAQSLEQERRKQNGGDGH